jgi:hypothetical protein
VLTALAGAGSTPSSSSVTTIRTPNESSASIVACLLRGGQPPTPQGEAICGLGGRKSLSDSFLLGRSAPARDLWPKRTPDILGGRGSCAGAASARAGELTARQ